VRLGRRFEPPRDLHAFLGELEQYYEAELALALEPAPPFAADVESRPA
jgi:hypothetical protein